MTPTPQEQQQLLQSIRQQLQQGTADVSRCSEQLSQLKLLQVAALAGVAAAAAAAAAPEPAEAQRLILARSTFETAAMLCVYQLQQQQQQQQQQPQDEETHEQQMKDTADAFQRHMNMLQPFYADLAHVLPPSELQQELQCLQLLHYLSGDCIAELHVAHDRLSEE
ncbi:26S proteasome regulatory particle non-ATPase subunit, putative, partial [Eimeria necatrix]